MSKTVVISVGGSLIAPGEIDVAFLKKFREKIVRYLQKDYKFAVICGGGSVARRYQKAASEVVNVLPEDLDWLGIHATRLNAHLLRTIFREYAKPRIITNPTREVSFNNSSIIVAAGWKPGFSTDYDAVLIAKRLGAKNLVNLTNVDYVCDKDPNGNGDAKPLPRLTWDDFLALLPEKWDPGINTPFDPVAAKQAKKLGMEIAILNGKYLERLEDYLDNKKITGTIVK